MQALIFSLFILAMVRQSLTHGLLTVPEQRGILSCSKFAPQNTRCVVSAPRDSKPHFPAGDKSPVPGAAGRSQAREARGVWTPFEPLKRNFRWRAGVCGDLKTKRDHMRGGQFYFGGYITRTYRQGGTINIEYSLVAHHNGFMEIHICDVKKCGGEISEGCFKNGHCYQLQRARVPVCETGQDRECGPVDRRHPGRWYLPCSRGSGVQTYGGYRMRYKLPPRLSCDHCVLHWFWSAANTCNPPGVIDYYDGPFRPKSWANCPGQGGARGGVTRVQRDCQGSRMPEEYYQCADIRIVGRSRNSGIRRSGRSGNISSIDQLPSEGSLRGNRGALIRLELVSENGASRVLRDDDEIDVGQLGNISIEAVTSRKVENVKFFVDGEQIWKDVNRRHIAFGNSGQVPNYWNEPVLNRYFVVRAEAGKEVISVRVRFNR